MKPVNNHLLIEPLKHDSFISTDKGIYEEIGTVIDIADALNYEVFPVHKGDKVFFDSWMAAKYPKNDKEFYWLVKWDDIRGVEKNGEKT